VFLHQVFFKFVFSTTVAIVMSRFVNILTYLLHGVEYYLKSWLSTSLSKNILLSFWNPIVHHLVYKSPLLDPGLSQLNPFVSSIPIS